ncbi:hypothetical protein [Candidatus Palauibacter sp.]|uniref:hypothetical protein n=1 Tax=Candidatus Palauibacter sp. TaxID=3101350 RepID=UPI003B52B1A1
MASDLEPRIAVSSETEHRGAGRGADSGSESDEGVLRAKYADYCSAQITEVFLSLADERIYEIVEEEAREQEIGPGELGFKAMVRLATKRLRESVPLPDFETWRSDYETAPELYEKYLMGLWRQRSEEDAREAD